MVKQNRIKDVPTDSQQRHFEPTQEEIQKKAYEIYQQKGGGDCVENWLEAERFCRNSSYV